MANHPLNLTNAVYLFAVSAVEQADINDALSGADVQESDTDQVKEIKTVRIGSYDALPREGAGGRYEEKDAPLSVEFGVVPVSQALEHRLDARETAHQMAMEFAKAIEGSLSLNGQVCRTEITRKENGYRNIKTGRWQISILHLLINPL